MLTDLQRQRLFAALTASLGEEEAQAMMSTIPPFDWADIARRQDVINLGIELRGEIGGEIGGLRGEFGELRGEFGELRGEFGELRGEFGELRGEFGELRGEFGELRGEFGELRGEVRALRSHVDARFDALFPKLVLANIATSAAFAGMVFGAFRLAGA